MTTPRTSADDHREQERGNRTPPRPELAGRDGEEADERADHEDVAVGEVDQADDAVDHRVAQGDQGVDEAQLEAVDHLLEQDRR